MSALEENWQVVAKKQKSSLLNDTASKFTAYQKVILTDGLGKSRAHFVCGICEGTVFNSKLKLQVGVSCLEQMFGPII